MNNISPATLYKMMRNRMSLFLTGTYRVTYAAQFVTDFENLVATFRSKFKVGNEYYTTFKSGVKSSFIPGVIDISKQFSPIINFNQYTRSYDYLGTRDNISMPAYTPEEYEKRGNLEISRYFNGTKAITPQDFSNIDNTISNAITDLQSTKNCFLSPLGFLFENKYIDITSLNQLDSTGLTETFLQSTLLMQDKIPSYKASSKTDRSQVPTQPNQKPTPNRRSLPKANTISVSIPENATSVTGIDSESLRKSQDYLGLNSTFVIGEENLTEPAKKTALPAMKQVIETTSRYRSSRRKNDFDITARESVIDKFISSKDFSEETLRKSPLSFKALLCSRAAGVKNNILSTSGDILQNPEMKVATEMLFMTTQ